MTRPVRWTHEALSDIKQQIAFIASENPYLPSLIFRPPYHQTLVRFSPLAEQDRRSIVAAANLQLIIVTENYRSADGRRSADCLTVTRVRPTRGHRGA